MFSVYHPADLVENGSWVQTYYCRYFKSKKSYFEGNILRAKTEREDELKLDISLQEPVSIRPFPAKFTNAATVIISTDLSLTRAKLLLEGLLVRQGCCIRSFNIEILSVVSEGKGQDCIVTKATRVFIKGQDPLEPKQSDAPELPKTNSELSDIILYSVRYHNAVQKLGIDLPKGILLYGSPGVGKTSAVVRVAKDFAIEMVIINGVDILKGGKGDGEKELRLAFAKAQEFSIQNNKPSIIFIDEIDSIAPSREQSPESSSMVAQLLTLMDGIESRGKLIVIGATNRPNSLDSALRRPGRFDRELEIKVPNKKDRFEALQQLTDNFEIHDDVDFELIAENTNGFVMADLVSLIREVAMIASLNNRTILNFRDFLDGLKKNGPSILRSSQIELEKLDWSDVGGVAHIKKVLQQAVEWPLLYKEKYSALGLKPPRGILLYGPPGNAKTTLVKILACRLGSTFLTVSGASMYSSLLGESEAQIRQLFRNARSAAPSIIFLDEIDALVGKRGFASGKSGDSVQERILSTLLNEMDGIELAKDVLVVGATNRPDLVDAALLRPGRFDKVILVPAPNQQARKEILQVYTRKMPVSNLDYDLIASETACFTGADLKSLCRETALNQLRSNNEEKLTTRDFLMTIKSISPSLSLEMIQQYDEFQKQFGGELKSLY
ncbi:hypothetical protein HDV06_006176 [Boothiomyces sp. JEL0866]|nr:hypothetical protein HDV06_006176 [Boothiomyces sp. JEL0866]